MSGFFLRSFFGLFQAFLMLVVLTISVGFFCFASYATESVNKRVPGETVATFATAEERLAPDHSYWQALADGRCDEAAYALTTDFVEARKGFRALLFWEEYRWTSAERLLLFPGLEFCLALRRLDGGMNAYRSSGASVPVFADLEDVWSQDPRKEVDTNDLYRGMLSLAFLSETYYGPALIEWARRISGGLLVTPDIKDAYESVLLAEMSGTSVEGSLMMRLSGKLDTRDRDKIARNLSEAVPDVGFARQKALGETWSDVELRFASQNTRETEITGYSDALEAGACDEAAGLVVEANAAAGIDLDKPWDSLYPDIDPDLFFCRAEAALERGEVLAAGADLTVLADLLYDPALLTLAKIYHDGVHLPADLPRAYRYLVLAEGFGRSDADLRLALEEALPEGERLEIDEAVKQGWPDLFRHLKETGKARLFDGPEMVPASGD